MIKIAQEKANHDARIFLLVHHFIRIEPSKMIITANSQGFILSLIAAGSKIKKNCNLSLKVFHSQESLSFQLELL